jgi:hypothetical protein
MKHPETTKIAVFSAILERLKDSKRHLGATCRKCGSMNLGVIIVISSPGAVS